MINFVNVSKRYPETDDVLRNVSFHLKRGEIAFLTGHSGAGKSTLLRLIAAMEKCSRGQVLLDGQDIGHTKESNFLIYEEKWVLYIKIISYFKIEPFLIMLLYL